MALVDRASLVIVAGHVISAVLGGALGVVLTLTLLMGEPSGASTPAGSADRAHAVGLPASAAAAAAPIEAVAPVGGQTKEGTAPGVNTATSATKLSQQTLGAETAAAGGASPPSGATTATPVGSTTVASAVVSNPAPPPSPAADTPKTRPAFLEPSPNRPRFFVQSGAFLSEELARKLSSRLSDRGYPSEVSPSVDETGRNWSIVRMVEVFSTRSDAERAAGLLKRDAEVDPLVVRQMPTQSAVKPTAEAQQ